MVAFWQIRPSYSMDTSGKFVVYAFQYAAIIPPVTASHCRGSLRFPLTIPYSFLISSPVFVINTTNNTTEMMDP